jgi:hypothetical protein
MVAAFCGESLTQEDISRWLGTTDIGTPASRVHRMSKRGFEVVYRQGSLDDVNNWLAKGFPCILFVRTGELSYWEYDTPHAVVLIGFEGNEALVLDPAHESFPVGVAVGDLMLAWSELGYTFAVLH